LRKLTRVIQAAEDGFLMKAVIKIFFEEKREQKTWRISPLANSGGLGPDV